MAKSIPIWAVALIILLLLAVALGVLVYLRWDSLVENTPQTAPPEFSRMELQGQYAGPLKGTVIQRWRDPVDGTICYIYVPMVVQHTPAPSGYVQYGSNSIGSISCMVKPAG